MLVATKPKLPTEVSEVRVPDSPLAIETTRFVSRITPLWLMNHVMRTYIFAELLGRKDKMKYDHEILYLGAIMHDLGLTDEFAGTQRFELDGADAARRFLLRQGVPKARVDLVWDAISFHTIVLDAVHLDEYLIQVPLRSDPSSFLSTLGSVERTKLLAPFPDGFICDLNTSRCHHLLNVPIAQGEAVVQPYTMLHYFDRKTVPTVSLRYSHCLGISQP
jgi:hypothetical protein